MTILTPVLACLALCLPAAFLALGKSAPTDVDRKALRRQRLRQLMAQAHSRKVIA